MTVEIMTCAHVTHPPEDQGDGRCWCRRRVDRHYTPAERAVELARGDGRQPAPADWRTGRDWPST